MRESNPQDIATHYPHTHITFEHCTHSHCSKSTQRIILAMHRDDPYAKHARSFVCTLEQGSIESAVEDERVSYTKYLPTVVMSTFVGDQMKNSSVTWLRAMDRMSKCTVEDTLDSTKVLKNGFLWGELLDKLRRGSSHPCSSPNPQCDFHTVHQLQHTVDSSRCVSTAKESIAQGGQNDETHNQGQMDLNQLLDQYDKWDEDHSSEPASFSDLISRTIEDVKSLDNKYRNPFAIDFRLEIIKELEACKSGMCEEGKTHLQKISDFVKTETFGEMPGMPGALMYKDAINQDGDVNWEALEEPDMPVESHSNVSVREQPSNPTQSIQEASGSSVQGGTRPQQSSRSRRLKNLSKGTADKGRGFVRHV